ncbi:MAG: Pr6Pr family membrane protein, partial [Ferruginibacter sp.]
PEILIRYFSYFTIDTNIIVAICCSILLVNPTSALGRFFSRPQTQTAICIYILVVGIVYNLILRFLWAPEGLQKAVDELLHSVIPVLFLLYWFLFVPKNSLQWRQVFPWLIYPFAYTVLVLIRGSFSGFYPYPFIDVNQLGLNKALLNAGGLTLVFLVISLLFIAIAKGMSTGKRVTA